MTVVGADGKRRCFGGEAGKEFYGEYHDNEWGVPVHDDTHLFEMLILEGAQAGLSWETILKRRQAYRDAYHHFDPVKVATMSDDELEEVLAQSGVIRHRLKVFAARHNAQVFLQIRQEFGTFSDYLWAFVDGSPLIHTPATVADIPVTTEQSDALSKDLRRRGMKFVGSTIIYAYMQAVGLVNDHVKDCWRAPAQLD